MADVEIAKMLVLSTGHVDRKTAAQLDDATLNDRMFPPRVWTKLVPMMPNREYGWIVRVDDDHTVRAHIPACLMECFDEAEKHGCGWLMFDRDGNRIDSLPYYEW